MDCYRCVNCYICHPGLSDDDMYFAECRCDGEDFVDDGRYDDV